MRIAIDHRQMVSVVSFLPPVTGNLHPLVKESSLCMLLSFNSMAYTHSSAVCQCIKMADANEKLLAELLKKPGNNMCADCGARSEWVFRKVLNKLVYYTTKGNANNTINYLVNYFSDRSHFKLCFRIFVYI